MKIILDTTKQVLLSGNEILKPSYRIRYFYIACFSAQENNYTAMQSY